MKFEWEEIYNNSDSHESGLYFEVTYRAKVFQGWLVRHEVFTDFQNENHCDETRFVDTEGYQNISNTTTFVPDPDHAWVID